MVAISSKAKQSVFMTPKGERASMSVSIAMVRVSNITVNVDGG